MIRKILFLGMTVLAATAAWSAEPLSDHMTVAEVEQALQANPPAPENVAARALIAQSMDKLIHFTVGQSSSDAQMAELKPLRDFYLRQVDRGLDELEKCHVTEGVRIFKFYSSSVIVKSRDGVVAIDFQQGPHLTFCGNADRPDPVATRSEFHWTPKQLERLAHLVDVSLITHAHSDHADYPLTKLLLAQGKTVVLSQQLRNLWSSLSGHLVVPTYGTAQKFGPVEIFTTVGSQYMQNDKATIDANGLATGYPSTDPKIVDAETVVYLARIGDVVFFQAAENNVPVDQWLRDGIAKGFRPDVKMSAGARQGARSVGDVLKETGPVFFLPIHEYEMGHPNGGNRTAEYYDGPRAEAITKGLMMPLFWGEYFSLKPSSFPWRNGAASTTAAANPD